MFSIKRAACLPHNHLKGLLASALLLCAATASASTGQDLCYPLAHGENGQGSTNSKYLAHQSVNAGWQSTFYVTNVSDKPVNIKLDFNDANGNSYAFPTTLYYDNFTSSNSPLDTLSGGAILTPGKTGSVILLGSSYPGTITGTITWQADACLESAIIATLRNVRHNSSLYSQGLFPLNNGEPF